MSVLHKTTLTCNNNPCHDKTSYNQRLHQVKIMIVYGGNRRARGKWRSNAMTQA